MFSVRKSSIVVTLALTLVLLVVAVAGAQGTQTVQTANNAKLGSILVDSKGMTLYIYTKDTTPNQSTCTGQCLVNWPALTVPAGQTPSAATGITGKLATFVRTDNQQTQVSYNGMPLYYWVNDKAPGDATGQGVGGVWFVVNPTSGTVMQGGTGTPAAAQATGTATATRAATTAPTVAATATRAATAAPAATATKAAAPGTLPTTGAPADWTLPFLAFIALFLVAGLGLNLARRTR